MLKYIGTFITFLLLPILLFIVAYFGMKIFTPTPVAPTIVPQAPQISERCGNAVCEKVERDAQSCTKDC